MGLYNVLLLSPQGTESTIKAFQERIKNVNDSVDKRSVTPHMLMQRSYDNNFDNRLSNNGLYENMGMPLTSDPDKQFKQYKLLPNFNKKSFDKI